ncbi:T6SS immunity protein Tli4 family protein [Pseudomonas putida]|uniref:T6SS immunity protein Tli4 family protein n=1 Tax=Pseudomonas putida TaxID=303 RepID=UPI00357155E9
MKNPEKTFKTVLVGRYTLNLPQDAVMSGASLELGGVPLSITPGYIKARMLRDAQKTWSIIESRNADNKEQTATQEKLDNGTLLYTYDHTRIAGQDIDGSVVNKVVHSTLAFQWKDNMKFELGNDSTLNKDEQIRLITKELTQGNNSVDDGLCYVNGCFPYSGSDEGIYIDFTFTDKPKLRAKFSSQHYGGDVNPPLSKRHDAPPTFQEQSKWLVKSEFEHRIYRNAKKMLNGLAGEEIIEASTKKRREGYLTEINAIWYYPGVPNSNEKPEIRLNLDYSFVSEQKPAGGTGLPNSDEFGVLTEAEFMTIWDNALDSLKLR